MARFDIEFARGQIKKPKYDNYTPQPGVRTRCGEDAQPRTIKFNDTTGDFIVGLNWDNSENGDLPPGVLTISSYQDYIVEANMQTGNQTVLTQYAGTLRDSSTGLDLTYPCDINVADLGNIEQHHNSVELVCLQSDLGKWRYTRVRSLAYLLADTAGNQGDISQTILINFNDT